MKTKLAVILIGLAFSALPLTADEVLVGTIEARTWNAVLERMVDKSFAVKLETDTGECSLLFWDWLTSAWYSLEPGQLESLRATLAKYFDWEALALAKAVKIQKEIPNSTLACPVVWKTGDEWSFGADASELRFQLFSQSAVRHQLLITGTKVTSKANEYIDFTLEGIYLDHDQVVDLANLLSEETLAAKLSQIREQEEIEKDFQ